MAAKPRRWLSAAASYQRECRKVGMEGGWGKNGDLRNLGSNPYRPKVAIGL